MLPMARMHHDAYSPEGKVVFHKHRHVSVYEQTVKLSTKLDLILSSIKTISELYFTSVN